MMKPLAYPFTEEKVRALRVGDSVQLSGRVFTARDRMHRYLCEGGKCPVNLRNGAIYHCGPVVVRKDGVWMVRAAGPTTSMRQELYMPSIIERLHVRVIVGKGGMGEGTREACKRAGAVYLQACGGAASLAATWIEHVEGPYFLKEFGAAEAMWDMTFRDFAAVVTMDAEGRSLHKRIEQASRRALRRALREGGPG